MKSYLFPVVVERDEDVWRAYMPELEVEGAATWRKTRDEALRNIQEVMQMIVEEYLEDEKSLPDQVAVKDQAFVAVNV
jgi:predicted RNase H-like HicB family nuclease